MRPGSWPHVPPAREEARAFKRWIAHEVLPVIRHTGIYSTGAPPSPINALDAIG